MRIQIKFLVLAICVTACGKKAEDDAVVEAAAGQAKDVAAIYSNVNTQLNSFYINKASSLALADATWTATDWGTTKSFPGKSSNVTAKDYITNQLNPDGSGALHEVVKKLAVFCYVGALFPDAEIEAGLPKVAASHALTVDDTAATRLKTNCGATDADVTDLKGGTLNVTVESVTGTVFDRHIVFTMGTGDSAEDNPFYIKNSDGVISVAMYEGKTDEGSGKTGIERTMLKSSVTSGVFQFEKVAFGDSGGTNGLEAFIRGYHNSTTKELAFVNTSSASSGTYFASVSSNDKESQAGAYLAINGTTSSDVEGAFACFKTSDSSFVNTTGCTENSDLNRKRAWNASSSLFSTVRGKGKDAWALSASTEVADFDSKTILSLEPTYK